MRPTLAGASAARQWRASASRRAEVSPSRRRADAERLVELTRDWRGRLRRVRFPRRKRRPVLPLWAWFGLRAPRLEWTLALVACGCALAGGVLIAVLTAPGGAR